MFRVGVLLAFASCGRVNFDSRTDASLPDDGGTPDACTFGPFSTPTRLPAIVQAVDDDWFPTPAVGDTQLFFYSFRAPSVGSDLWVAERATSSSPYGAPTRVTSLATPDDEGEPTLTDDGLEIVFSIKAAGDFDLYTSRRTSPTGAWGATSPLVNLNTGTVEFSPFVSGDGLRLWFSTARGASATDLYEVPRSSRTDAFAAPRLVPELMSAVEDRTPTLSHDGLEIFFVSDRPGGPGMYDVYTARRPSLDQPFAMPRVVPELSSARDDYGLRLSPDGTTMDLNYDTLINGGGLADMWSATRACQ